MNLVNFRCEPSSLVLCGSFVKISGFKIWVLLYYNYYDDYCGVI